MYVAWEQLQGHISTVLHSLETGRMVQIHSLQTMVEELENVIMIFLSVVGKFQQDDGNGKMNEYLYQ